MNCDSLTGQCSCRAGYTGLKCNECDNGYYSQTFDGENQEILTCSLCRCNQQGSTYEICSKDSGACLCKENFIGEKCDQFAPGYFGPQCQRK